MPYVGRDRISPHERKYIAPPGPGEPGTSAHPNGRTKDDLHEWSIFRQNLTSHIADSFLSRDAGGGSGGLLKAAVGGSGQSKSSLPYGDFQMHDQTVQSVLSQARKEDHLMGQQDDVYLRYGLPRLNLTTHRRSQSELDLRQVEEDRIPVLTRQLPSFPSRGPYAMRGAESLANLGQGKSSNANGPFVMSSRDKYRGFQSVDVLDQSREYAPSNSGSNVIPGLTPYRQRRPGAPAWHNNSMAENMMVDGGGTDALSGYWDVGSRRHHHGHYFSNLNLFTQSTSHYNYLHYAKAEESQLTPNKNPHLILRDFQFDTDERSSLDIFMLRAPRYRRVIENVSFELYGGETLAIMYTSSFEAKGLLNSLANHHRLRGRTEGDLVVNGLKMKRDVFGGRTAFVCLHELCPYLTVHEHLKLTVALCRPATVFKTKSMITQLIQTLALSPFRDRRVGALGRTEKYRVKLACQILLDTGAFTVGIDVDVAKLKKILEVDQAASLMDVILVEDIFKSMDLYDAAFLIDYLKDWAQKLSRIVITIYNPPTYELLSMFYKTAILASGRLVYFGKPSKLTEYFESMGHPCPLLKSPCDYYVDLVTLDTLSPEALKETKDRISHLADSWLAKRSSLPEASVPGMPPPRVRKPSCIVVIWWLFVRFWWLLINRPWDYLSEMLYSASVSALLGLIFMHLSETQGGVDDRFSLIFCLLTVGLLPNLMLNIDRVHTERALLFNDVNHRLYSSAEFYISKVLFDVPFALATYMCYLMPVYFMAGLFTGDLWIEFGLFTAIFLLYCMSLRFLTWVFAYMTTDSFHAFALLGVFLSIFALSSGALVHSNDLWFPFRWAQLSSPVFWAFWNLNQLEFTGFRNSKLVPTQPTQNSVQTSLRENVFLFSCDVRQVQYGSILTTLLCPVRSGPEAMVYTNLSSVLPANHLNYNLSVEETLFYIGVPVIAGWGFIAFFINFCCISCNYEPKSKCYDSTLTK